MTIVPQLDKYLEFISFRGVFCVEYSDFYPPEKA